MVDSFSLLWYTICVKGKENPPNQKGDRKMFEVYWYNWRGREEEPEAVFDTWEEADEYVFEQKEQCAPDEGYYIMDLEANRAYAM